MSNALKEFFYYTKTERRGAIALLLICIFFVLLPIAYPFMIGEPEEEGYEAYAEAVQRFLADTATTAADRESREAKLFFFDPNTLPQDSLVLLGLPRKTAQTIVKFRAKVRPFRRPEDLLDIYTLSEADYHRIVPYVRIEQAAPPAAAAKSKEKANSRPEAPLFPFDPNTLSGDSLQMLGLPGRTVRTLLNYREKGGRFREKEDLKRIYGMRAEDYERLHPYIRIREQPIAKSKEVPAARPAAYAASAPAAPSVLDINLAGPAEWEQLPGIGPAYARRICSFRDKLGGFASVAQVAETYGLPDSTFQQLQPRLKASPVFRPIAINKVDAATLKAHPYLSWKQANAIIAYRNQHGSFRSVEEVKKVRALPAELHGKMAPYWTFD